MASTSSDALPAWKSKLIDLALASGALQFGPFTLKSGRISPYFVNCGLFSHGEVVSAVATAYANALNAQAEAEPGWGFDVLFGPAYKGIPLCATTTVRLQDLNTQRWGDIGYSFNRKEKKDHGEGGLMIGDSLQGKRVVIIDDVMTAGTAIREAISIIEGQGGKLVGIIVAIDRQEKMPSEAEKAGKEDDGQPRGSTIGEVRRETGVPVLAVLTLGDIMKAMESKGRTEEVAQMQAYYEKYKPSD
ncbi:orotate phosphoribosyltransferase-like [Teratosphaeria destructans]|uniref:Orotate phosphoribosyltransferase n=1 Tax=Teratosphaeria destructans TaxID=418781 RepID=A0A9W7SL84_9PEZI|nr:orotate phosphoribosyltransferase-like [Teratosphaeria destructans]